MVLQMNEALKTIYYYHAHQSILEQNFSYGGFEVYITINKVPWIFFCAVCENNEWSVGGPY